MAALPHHFLGEVACACGVLAPLAQEIGRVHQHAARAGGRVVDRVSGAWLKNAHQRVHNLGRREELAGLGAGVVGELFK